MKERIYEIRKNLTAVNKEKYSKKEYLSELLSLQNQMVSEAFTPEHTENAFLKLWDVEKHFAQLNESCGGVADDLLESFSKQSRQFSEMIKAEICGAKGENKAYKSLQTSSAARKILRNIELKSEDHKTEIDLVVISNSVVFLIEVKNTAKNIVIDEKGNYCRIAQNGDLVFDKNIGEKMNEKEYLLREALKKYGFENIDMRSLVVFTNSAISVQNDYPYITECYLSQLPHIVENSQGVTVFSEQKISKIAQSILSAQCKDEYYVEMDVEAFKNIFSTLLATLEQAKAKENEKSALATKKTSNPFARLFKKLARVACLIFS